MRSRPWLAALALALLARSTLASVPRVDAAPNAPRLALTVSASFEEALQQRAEDASTGSGG